MRTLKFIIALLLPALMTLVLALPSERMRLWAQLPPSNPNLAPLVTPVGVPSLSQPAATIGIPTLAVIPTPAAISTAVTQRVFNCSCFGPGSGTHWMGQISASGYFPARQSATSACLSYNEEKQPAPPLNYASSFAGAALSPSLPGASLAADAATAQVRPGTLNFSSAAELQMCSRCTCD
jgi:hypothetical protein